MKIFKTRRFIRLSLIAFASFLYSQSLFGQNALNLAGLDNKSVPTVAYSVRKLSSSYAGPAIQVRRSSDNATADIGFAGNGDLDVTALTSFVGANNAFVTIWYDQSGNGKNLTQPAANRQPWIVHSGVVDQENSRPFIRFYGHNGIDNVTDRLDLSPEMTTTGLVSVVNKFAPGGDGFLLGHTSVYNWHADINAGKLFVSYASSSITNARVWQNGTAAAPLSAIYNTTLMVNSVAPQSPSVGTTWNNLGSDRDTYHDTNLGGGYSELIVFATAPSSFARTRLENNQGVYYSIAVANNYLDRRGALVASTSGQINKFGQLGASPMLANGETAPQGLPQIPTTGSLVLTGATTATLVVTMNSNDGVTTTTGICWGTSPNPTIANSRTSTVLTSLKSTATMTALVNGTTYYVRSYATNALGTVYGNEISFTHLSPGYAYQGGKVVYILQPGDPGFVDGEVHGLIVSSQKWTSTIWGCSGTNLTGADSPAIGSGAPNTADIVAGCSTAGIAARLCDDYSVVDGGITYSDWYLPSQEELHKLYLNKAAIGGIDVIWIKSSTESGASSSIVINSVTGDKVSRSKTVADNVYAFRSF